MQAELQRMSDVAKEAGRKQGVTEKKLSYHEVEVVKAGANVHYQDGQIALHTVNLAGTPRPWPMQASHETIQVLHCYCKNRSLRVLRQLVLSYCVEC